MKIRLREWGSRFLYKEWYPKKPANPAESKPSGNLARWIGVTWNDVCFRNFSFGSHCLVPAKLRFQTLRIMLLQCTALVARVVSATLVGQRHSSSLDWIEQWFGHSSIYWLRYRSLFNFFKLCKNIMIHSTATIIMRYGGDFPYWILLSEKK